MSGPKDGIIQDFLYRGGRNNLMRILVTGAGGLIGSQVLKRLHDSGDEVFGIYRQPPIKEIAGNYSVVDLLSEDALDRLFEAGEFDAVVHCAAVLPGTSLSGIGKVSRNREIDEVVAKFCSKLNAIGVYISSSIVYGNDLRRAPNEGAMVPNSLMIYALQKLRGEKLFGESCSRAVSLRVCAPYGPGQRNQTVLWTFIEHALAEQPLLYNGTGVRSQSFTHVEDIAAAIETSIYSNASGIFNIAGERDISTKELAKIVVGAVPNCKSEVRASGQPDLQEGYRGVFDCKRAFNILNWRPRIGIEEGILQCIQGKEIKYE